MKLIAVLALALLLEACAVAVPNVSNLNLPTSDFFARNKAIVFHNDGPEIARLTPPGGDGIRGPTLVSAGATVRITWDNGYAVEVVK